MTEPVEVGDIFDVFDYEVPEVIWRPINSDDGEVAGYKVDPPFDWAADNLVTLRHYAALIEHRTGLKLRVGQSDGEDELVYHVLAGHVTGGPAPYEVTWAWLSGFESGIQELLWRAAKDADGSATPAES
jgi:hypothetical protein